MTKSKNKENFIDTIKINLLHENAVVPTKAHDSDTGYDLVATSIDITEDYVEYGLGFSTEFTDLDCQIRPRSSISKYDLTLCNSVGTIDSSYRGEWKVRFNLTISPRLVKSMKNKPLDMNHFKLYNIGDRVAQLVVSKHCNVEFKQDLLSESERTGGFGSTGN